MEKYRKKLRMRMLLMSLAIILATILLFMNSIKMVETPEGEDLSTGFIDGFQSGLLAAMVGLFVVFIIKYLLIYRDEKKLKLWYNHENDERRQQIKLKAGGNLVIINSVILLFAGIIGGYFNVVIFYSVIACALFQLLVSAFIKIYLLNTH